MILLKEKKIQRSSRMAHLKTSFFLLLILPFAQSKNHSKIEVIAVQHTARPLKP